MLGPPSNVTASVLPRTSRSTPHGFGFTPAAGILAHWKPAGSPWTWRGAMRPPPVPMHDARATCYDCLRPRLVCICDVLRPVDNRTRLTILQHPRERRHPLNTVGIAEGSLTNVRVLRGNVERLAQR